MNTPKKVPALFLKEADAFVNLNIPNADQDMKDIILRAMLIGGRMAAQAFVRPVPFNTMLESVQQKQKKVRN